MIFDNTPHGASRIATSELRLLGPQEEINFPVLEMILNEVDHLGFRDNKKLLVGNRDGVKRSWCDGYAIMTVGELKIIHSKILAGNYDPGEVTGILP